MTFGILTILAPPAKFNSDAIYLFVYDLDRMIYGQLVNRTFWLPAATAL